jgi:hypothetical protein
MRTCRSLRQLVPRLLPYAPGHYRNALRIESNSADQEPQRRLAALREARERSPGIWKRRHLIHRSRSPIGGPLRSRSMIPFSLKKWRRFLAISLEPADSSHSRTPAGSCRSCYRISRTSPISRRIFKCIWDTLANASGGPRNDGDPIFQICHDLVPFCVQC